MAIIIDTVQINAKFLGGMALNKIMLGVIEIFPNIGGTPPTWDPSDLFAANDDGLFYNFNVIGSLFQLSTGNTPVTAGGQPIGAVIDLRKKGALGAETLADPTFNNPGEWFFGTNVSISNNQLIFADAPHNTSANNASDAAMVTGKAYSVTVDVESLTGGLTIVLGGVQLTIPSAGQHTFTAIPFGPWKPSFTTVGTTSAVINSYSVKEQLGNAAIQTTAAARPLADSRYNLVQATENFADSFWTKTNAVASKPLTVLAPDGTLTGNLLTDDATNGVHGLTRAYAFPTPNNVDMNTISVYVKQDTARYVWFNVGAGPNNWGIVFDTQLGVITAGPTPPFADTALPPEDVGNGWWRLSLKTNYASANTAYFGLGISSDGTIAGSTYAGSGQSVCVWGAQSQFGAIPTTYQWVNTATDYNWQIAPLRASFDGTDDGLASTPIDLSTSPVVTVFFGGIRRATGRAYAYGQEPAYSGNTFSKRMPENGTLSQHYWARYLNGVLQFVHTTQNEPAPETFVDSCVYRTDIAGSAANISIIPTLNGNVPATAFGGAGGQGPGFSNDQITIGKTLANANPNNMAVSYLVIINRECTPAEHAQMDAWGKAQMGITP